MAMLNQPRARHRQRERHRKRLALGGAVLGGALTAAPAPAPQGFAARQVAPAAAPQPQQFLGSPGGAIAARAPASAAASLTAATRRRDAGQWRRAHTVRRIFDTGSFFGVGVSEATVIALLGWFLLGPEELYRLAKQAGNWLGELRTFVGQAARQYESALDDDSTRKAIEGIRETQRTVSEISESWRSVTDSLRNPLALGSTLESVYSKYGPADKAGRSPDAAAAASGEAGRSPDAATPVSGKAATESGGAYPDLTSSEPEAVDTVQGPTFTAKKELGTGTLVDKEPEETLEELQRKREASKQAVADMWYSQKAEEERPKSTPERAEEFVQRLDKRLSDLDGLVLELEELRSGIIQDRQGLQRLLQVREAEVPVATQPEKVPAAVEATEKLGEDKIHAQAVDVATPTEKVPAAVEVPAGRAEPHVGGAAK